MISAQDEEVNDRTVQQYKDAARLGLEVGEGTTYPNVEFAVSLVELKAAIGVYSVDPRGCFCP